MRLFLVPAALAGLVLSPLAQRLADAVAAPRTLPWWLVLLPYVFIGFIVGTLLSSLRGHRRRQSAFVFMRGRVKCPECEYLLDLDDRHCAKCGAAVVEIKRREQCPKCRARNWEDDAHCRQCGSKLHEDDLADS